MLPYRLIETIRHSAPAPAPACRKAYVPGPSGLAGEQMKCSLCGAELDLLEIVERGRVFECCECAYILMLQKGHAPRIVYNGPPPLDYYFHD